MHWRRDRLPTSVLDFPGSSAGKESAHNAGDLGSIPGLGRSPGEGKGYSLQDSGLENSGLYSPWGHKESDITDKLSLSLSKTFSQFVVIHTVKGFSTVNKAKVDFFFFSGTLLLFQ